MKCTNCGNSNAYDVEVLENVILQLCVTCIDQAHSNLGGIMEDLEEGHING